MIPCEYIKTCPSVSGWCSNRHPDVQCVRHILIAYQNLLDDYQNLPQRYDSMMEHVTEIMEDEMFQEAMEDERTQEVEH